MALILKDRVKESSSSSGTGSITLGGAFPGYQTFNAAIATGSTVYYTIHNLTAGSDTEWEVGVGTFTSPSTLSRDTVLSSSTGSKVNFTSGVSGLEVFVTQPAEQAIYINDATNKVEAFGNGANTITFTNINTTNLTANTVTLTAGTITTNAANATDITNKTYVDGLFSTGISYHAPVLVESTAALTAVYVQPNGAGNGVGATLTNSGANAALVIDGVTLSNTARVLVDNQSNAVQNGVYTVTNPGNATAQWVLTRANDANTFGLANPNTLGQGDAFFVSSGNNGAGRTYICNTQGTITFGSTNITFAQISSAQIYSAGTGLSLNNLAFSISNTAVTAGTYGDAGTVGTFTVNAQGQLTAASNAAINASSITLGTLANARTTASDANGASTIVARDANGSFTANVITATDVNSTNVTATTGSFTNISGNAATITNINASNISSGTISNARTTGSSSNSASTLVLRDANGAFEGGNVTAANFIGAGTTITSINASNISSGTIANARTTADSANGASTIVQRDAGGNFSANTITANVSGSGSGLTNINASNITSGTIGNAFTTANSSNGASTIVLRGASGEFAAGAITGTSFSGNGSALTNINASAITTGTLDNARTNATSANGASTLVVRDANGSFAGNVITASNVSVTTGLFGNGSNTAPSIAFTNSTGTGLFLPAANTVAISTGGTEDIRVFASGGVSIGNTTDPGATNLSVTGTIAGNGAPLTGINASNIASGTIANARTTAATANGASTIVLRGTSGEFSAGIITADGSGLSAINASNISSGTIANARTTAATANGASTIVLRGTSGEFSAGAITGASFTGDGAAISNINASNLAAGTVASARVSGSYTGITGVGTLTAGTWNANSISTTFTDAKVTSIAAGTGISVNATTGAVTVTNGGVTSLTAGTGISLSGSTGGVTITNTSTGATITDDTTTNATRYPIFDDITSGTLSSAFVSSTKLTFNPSTGTLSATVMTASSDARFKDDVVVISNALDKTCQIRGVTYVRNDVDNKSRHVGVIAQEVEAVLPEVITTDKDGYKAVAYGNMIGLLVEAIKELKAEVDALKGK